MSSASSPVTYTSVYTNSEPGRVFWGADEELLDGGSPRVIVYGYDGLPMLPEAPPSPYYVPGPEELQTPPAPQDEDEHEPMFIQPHDPDFAEVKRLLAMPTSSPSPLASLSPPSAGERLDRCTAPAALPSPPLPPPLHIPPSVDRMDDIPETEMPPRKRLGLSTLGSKYEVEESSTARPTGCRGIDYGFVSTLDVEARRRRIREFRYGIRDTWLDPIEIVPEIEPTTVGEVNTRVTELVELHEHDIHDLYALLKDAQDSRTRISQRVAVDSQRVDLLMKDMIAHQKTIQFVEDEAYAARTSFTHSCQY
nr:hypothetical protein [Tanacetum cinerariifolium]